MITFTNMHSCILYNPFSDETKSDGDSDGRWINHILNGTFSEIFFSSFLFFFFRNSHCLNKGFKAS
jgi:hypothetical protein